MQVFRENPVAAARGAPGHCYNKARSRTPGQALLRAPGKALSRTPGRARLGTPGHHRTIKDSAGQMTETSSSTGNREFRERDFLEQGNRSDSSRIALVALLASGCDTFQIVRPFVLPVAWGIIIATAIFPAYRWLGRMMGGRERLAAVVLTLIGLILLIVPSLLSAGSLVENASWLSGGLRDGSLEVPLPPDEHRHVASDRREVARVLDPCARQPDGRATTAGAAPGTSRGRVSLGRRWSGPRHPAIRDFDRHRRRASRQFQQGGGGRRGDCDASRR